MCLMSGNSNSEDLQSLIDLNEFITNPNVYSALLQVINDPISFNDPGDFAQAFLDA